MGIHDDINWPPELQPHEWPGSVIEDMHPRVFTDAAIPLRLTSGIPMWPSALPRAHVRQERSNSQHSTHEGERLSTATDMHCRTYAHMIQLMHYAQRIESIGGIGAYFNTRTPMIHVDIREQRLLWVATHDGKYVYLAERSTIGEQVRFFDTLARELARVKP